MTLQRWRKLPVMIAAIIAITGCASRAVKTETVSRVAPGPDPYTIGAGDEVEIVVWKQPALSGKTVVAEDGTVTIALVGHVAAAGQTTDEVQGEVRKQLGKYVKDSNVTVRVDDQRSMIYYVVGEVHKPGVFVLHDHEVLSQAIAEAGGFSDFADPSAVRIVRRTPTRLTKIMVDYRRVLDGRDLSADVALERGDTVFVP